jgi:FtsP/CotA-like multicopper oxidase with cupredoxin domain
MAVQSSDGLVGPLVIHSKQEKKLQQIPYVTDRVVMLQDWYHDLSTGLLIEALEPGSESSPIPHGALMNGMNKRDCSNLSHRMCDNSTATLPSLDLTANANHRLRFINSGAFAWFQIEVDEHEFAISEVRIFDFHSDLLSFLLKSWEPAFLYQELSPLAPEPISKINKVSY